MKLGRRKLRKRDRLANSMALIHFTEIPKHFFHIDATFVSCRLELPGQDNYFRVRFYPWWEHPLYQQAIERGETWGFQNTEEGEVEITVYPRNVMTFCISQHFNIEGWDFVEEHPLLWQYEDWASILCNSALSFEQALELTERVRASLTDYARTANLEKYLPVTRKRLQWYQNPPFSLGAFPYSLYHPVRTALDLMQVEYLSSREPQKKPMPKLFLVDSDYIMADDFEIDVPEIVHKPEWFFQPGSDVTK